MARATLTDTPTTSWTAALPVMDGTTPIFAYGAIIYADGDLGVFRAVDFQTGKPLWGVDGPQVGLETPAVCGGVLYLCTDDGCLYAASPVTGDVLWELQLTDGSSLTPPVPGSGYLPSTRQPGSVVYTMDANNVYAVPAVAQDGPPAASTVFATDGSFELGTNLAYDGTSGRMVVNTSRGLAALDVDTASPEEWPMAWHVDLGGYVTPATLAMGKVFVGTQAQTMALVDVSSGEWFASAPLGAQIEQPVLVDPPNNSAYVPTETGTIVALDATSAKRTTSLTPGKQPTTPLTLSDGIVYYGSADNHMYAFELASPNGPVTGLDASEPITFLAGVSSGSAYFGTQSRLLASQFSDLIHQFNSQSQLMVDFTRQMSSYQQTPAYQTNIQLYDPSGNVRSRESIKVWASAPVNLTTDNQGFVVDHDAPAAFESDAAGRIVISVQADTNISASTPSGLSTPALTLWASFMAPDERILIYPDQRLHGALQTITGAQLQAAQTYSDAGPAQKGAALLPSGFQGSEGTPGRANADALASAINNTIGMNIPAQASAGTAPTYLAYPETMLGVSHSATPPDTTRPAVSGAIPTWSLTLTGPSGATFNPNITNKEAAATIAGWPAARAAAGLPPGGIFTDIADFVKNVINGAESITETVWQKTEQVISAAIATAENSYHFTVETIEDAAHVVLGLLKSVLGDVENAVQKIIEALSFLFDWDDILLTHAHIKATINTGFTQVTGFITRIEDDIDNLLDRISNIIANDFGTLIKNISNQGSLGTVAGPTDPNQAYTTNGSDNYSVHGNWLLHKTMGGALGTGGSVAIGAPTLALTGASTAASETVTQAMQQFLQNLAADAAKVSTDVYKVITAAADDLMTALFPPDGAQGAHLADLLGKLESLLLELVALAKDAADDFCNLLIAIVDSLQDALNASIEIPFVTWLYREITGDQLSVLDLFTLILAVPVTVMYKAITDQPPYSNGSVTRPPGTGRNAQPTAGTTENPPRPSGAAAPRLGSLNIMNMASTFNGLIYSYVDLFSNALAKKNPPLLSFLSALNATAAECLNMPISSDNQQESDYVARWVYGMFPIAWNVYSGLEAVGGDSTSNNVLPSWAIGAAIWDAGYAIAWPQDYFGDDGLKLVQNELGNLSTIAGFAKNSDDEEVLAVLMIVDYFLDTASALIGIKYW